MTIWERWFESSELSHYWQIDGLVLECQKTAKTYETSLSDKKRDEAEAKEAH